MKTNIILLISLLLFLFMSCSKDKGFYDQPAETVKFDGNVLEYLQSKPGVFDSLLKVLDRTEMNTPLSGDQPLTLFAPTNPSFQLAIENLNNTRREADRPLEYLLNVELSHLDTMMAQYIIKDRYPSDSMMMKDGLPLYDFKYQRRMNAKLTSATSSGFEGGGPKVIEFSDTKNSQFTRDWITANSASINIEANNGIIHVLSSNHVFGFNDFVSRFTYIPPPPNLFVTVGGLFSVSRENSGGDNAVEASKYVFDGNPETKFLLGDFSAEWMQVELHQETAANAYTLTSANDFPDRDPKDWTLQGSHNGSDWVTLDSKSGEEFTSRFQQRVFWINNTTAYKFYRLNIQGLRNGNSFQMADWSVNRGINQ
ncbi:MAG: fasciclin domain-containing protein [Sphingobacterium sp.]